MITISDFGIYASINERKFGMPDVLVFANDHSGYDLEQINNCINKLFPHGTEIWTEGDPNNQDEIVNPEKHRINGWDNAEHCRAMKKLVSQAESLFEEGKLELAEKVVEEIEILKRANYKLRHQGLIDKMTALKPHDVILVGSSHVIKSPAFMSNVWEEDKECVEDFHAKLASLKLWSVIIRCDSRSEITFTAEPAKPAFVSNWVKRLIPTNGFGCSSCMTPQPH